MVLRTTNINSPMDSLEHKISIKNILINIFFIFYSYNYQLQHFLQC